MHKMEGFIQHKKFKDIDLTDSFFNSLRADYHGFNDWFARKSEEKAYVLYNDNSKLEAFLYLKFEEGPITDVDPIINCNKALKIGTLKINPHGTRLGERFIKRALDLAINEHADGLYVTVFEKHSTLVTLLFTYGFKIYGDKGSTVNKELVLWKSLLDVSGDILLDYPRIIRRGKKKYLLAIFPKYHTRLFPDSILKNERFDVIEDVSHTNSIQKVYVSFAPGVSNLSRGDLVVIYRTTDKDGLAKYRSVATSICVVEEVKVKSEFSNESDFVQYCNKFSVFTPSELADFYLKQKRLTVIKMTYNIALRKRLTRERLINEVGLEPKERWTFMELTDNQFDLILARGDAHESLIID